MNKLATVIFAYTPQKDDELELKKGDKIEVLGFEEAGWLKGRLKGRIGVFPENFVQVIEANSPHIEPQSIVSSPPTNHSKLNLLGSKTSKTSLSSNSLNSNNSNSAIINSNNHNNSVNNNTNNLNNNLIMNNTQHHPDTTNPGLNGADDQSINPSERRPKPIRGVGYGDIFAAAGKSKPSAAMDSVIGNSASERLSTGLVGALQKQIPKKPPPPTPSLNDSMITSTDQAPALPPKPGNQFSPHLQNSSRPSLPAQQPPPLHQLQMQHQSTQQAREQAKVIYAYEPMNDDELAINVGDIIDIIDKDIEDAGWWRGRLRGKVGVFPDNFVTLIGPSDHWHSSSADSSTPSRPIDTASPPVGALNYNQSSAGIESKSIKSVFAATPKGFSKELENNLERHNSPASFLSLKRNKLQQQMSSSLGGNEHIFNENGKRDEVGGVGSGLSGSHVETANATTKLNHITANRAKGPSRRPPSNLMNKKNQVDQTKRDMNGSGRDESPLGSLPINSTPQPTAMFDSMPSLPAGQNSIATPPAVGPFSLKPNDLGSTSAPAPNVIKPSLSLDDVLDKEQTPKTSLRTTQPPTPDKNKITTSPRPPWMVQLKKTTAEKKRDTPSATASVHTDNEPMQTPQPPPPVAKVSEGFNDNNTVTTPNHDLIERRSTVQSLRGAYNPNQASPIAGAVKSLSSRYSGEFNNVQSQNDAQRSSLVTNAIGNLQNNSINVSNTNNELSPVNRLGGTLSKSSPPNKSEIGGQWNSSSHGSNVSSIGSESNNTIVPSSHNASGKTSSVNQVSAISVSQSIASENSITPPAPVNQALETTPPAQPKPLEEISRSFRESEKHESKISPEQAEKIVEPQLFTNAQYDNLLRHISKNVNSEISELREEVKRLRGDLQGFSDLKSVLDVMRNELRACQNASESQKRYMKELVNNLADERKKIAAMQVEIDRNLK